MEQNKESRNRPMQISINSWKSLQNNSVQIGYSFKAMMIENRHLFGKKNLDA